MSNIDNMSKIARTSSDDDVTDSDRISNLPKPVLYRILSFLPTEDAVATSFLSRKWKFLWRNIRSVLFVDDDDCRLFRNTRRKHKSVKFARFVNKVLLLLNGECIDEFNLLIRDYSVLYDVSTWIETAVARNLKALRLSHHTRNPRIQLPCNLFTCETLEALVLCGALRVKFPSLVCLPNLEHFDLESVRLSVTGFVCLPNVKFLRLESVTYQSDECVSNLISGCSSLCALDVGREAYDNVVTFTISSPTLRKLAFSSFDREVTIPEELVCKLKIDAPALRYLYLVDCWPMDFSIENLCSLDEAEVRTLCCSFSDYPYSKTALKLLQGIYNVEDLTLSGDIYQGLSHAGASPSFPNLIELTAELELYKWNPLLSLVQGSDKLEYLNVLKGHVCKHEPCWTKPEKVPTCLLSSLETMVMRGFEGLECELTILAYFLENAKILKTMGIVVRHTVGAEARDELIQKITKLPKGSEVCEIRFV